MEDSVKIMTIHSAKGLESEVIFLAQTYLPNSRKSKLKIVPDFNDDLSCKDLYLNIPKVFKNNYYIENNFLSYNGKEILEENNLLYVACTRAKKFLIINGFAEKKYSQSWFSNFLISQ
jgi:ATP-dependent helicase/nuclease subunit A